MERLLALQLKRIAYLIDSLEDVKMDIVTLEDATYTTFQQYDDNSTLTDVMEAIRELKKMQHDINQIRRRLIQR